MTVARVALRTVKKNTDLTILPAKAMLPWFSTQWTTNRISPHFLKSHRIHDTPVDSTEGNITLLFKICILTEDMCKQMRPAVFRHPRLNGLSKIHKEDVTLIPTVSNIGAPTYELSKYLAGDLSHFTGKFGTTWEKLLPALPDIEISTSTIRSNV